MTQWQPPQYDPRQHQRRIGGQPQYPPQPQPWEQPGYGQPPQQPQPQPPAPPARKPRPLRGCLTLIVLAGVIAVIIAVATSKSGGNSPQQPPAATQAASSAPAQPQTVTYVVTGSPADVTYGPAGSDQAGTVPMHKTASLGTPAYYAISAQLQGGGAVSCEIKVDGAVISRATASGSYNIASCEISQDPASGQWQDVNQG